MLRWTAFFSLLAIIASLVAFVGILIETKVAQITFVIIFLIVLVSLLLGISPLKNKQGH